MTTGKDKLATDLQIIEQMVAKMKEYLADDTIFWQKLDNDLMQPTLGGYWLREHRLLALQNSLLDNAQRRRLRTTVDQFTQIYHRHREQGIDKAGREFEARIHQWQKALEDLLDDDPPSIAYYRSDVEFRVIIEHLSQKLTAASAPIKTDVTSQINSLDRQLQKHLQPGSFIWSSEWQPAYPKNSFWWLYGSLD